MSAELLAAVGGLVLSLVFSYIPGLNVKYDALEADKKRLIMLGMLAAVALAIYGMACAGWAARLGIDIACTEDGAWEVAQAFFYAMVANQGAYQLTIQSRAVKAARKQVK